MLVQYTGMCGSETDMAACAYRCQDYFASQSNSNVGYYNCHQACVQYCTCEGQIAQGFLEVVNMLCQSAQEYCNACTPQILSSVTGLDVSSMS